jgi:hypothetical protein
MDRAWSQSRLGVVAFQLWVTSRAQYALDFLDYSPSPPARAALRAGKSGHLGRFPVSKAGYVQTLSLGNPVFHHLIRSRGTPRDHRRRNR